MKVAVFATNTSAEYSGGRYHSLIIALSLGFCGNDVYYITNNIPVFYDDFRNYHDHINMYLTNDFENDLPRESFDIVILTPQMNLFDYFLKVRLFSLKNKSKLVLINFESGNWFNLYAKKDIKLWDSWKECCQDGCLILSSSQEGNKYAKNFYVENFDVNNFKYWRPSINTFIAQQTSYIKREKNRILILTRISDKHKGFIDIKALFSKNLSNKKIVLLIGTSCMNIEQRSELSKLALKFNISLLIKYKLSDYDKFIEYRKATLLVFPSYFEGYGYPPIEALYCNTPCIAYDLPVLREVTYNSNNLIVVSIGNKNDLINKVSDFFETKVIKNIDEEELKVAVNFELNAICLEKIIQSYLISFNQKTSLLDIVFLKLKLLKLQINMFICKHILYSKVSLKIKRIWKLRRIKKLSSINFQLNKSLKIVIYGAGTIAQAIIPKINKSIVCIIDSDSSKENQFFENYPIKALDVLESIYYDYILITPKDRELEIIKQIQKKVKVSINKFLVL